MRVLIMLFDSIWNQEVVRLWNRRSVMMNEKEKKEKESKKNLSELEEADLRIRRNTELTNTIRLDTQEEIANFWEDYDGKASNFFHFFMTIWKVMRI